MKEKPTIFIFERGIDGWASIFGDYKKNWPNLACTWIHTRTPHRAQTLLYFVGAIFAGLTRHRRALQFSMLIRAYSVLGWQIVIVAHSEGTATAVEALRLAGWPKIKALHLLCGACDANFERNGLNHALKTGKIEKVFVYIAGKDRAMKIEDTLLGLMMFGISWNDCPLGLSGPTHLADSIYEKIVVIRRDGWEHYGHSDCWLPKNFWKTMKNFIKPLATPLI